MRVFSALYTRNRTGRHI